MSSTYYVCGWFDDFEDEPCRIYSEVGEASLRAELLTDGRVRLELPRSNLLFLQWALWTTVTALDQDERWFRGLSGVSLAEAWALSDELRAIVYALEGELVPSLKPRRINTAWDSLPKMEAENLPDLWVAVSLPQEKLAILPELVEASLVYVAPHRTESEKQRFRVRFASSTEEAEGLREELRRLGREMRMYRKIQRRT